MKGVRKTGDALQGGGDRYTYFLRTLIVFKKVWVFYVPVGETTTTGLMYVEVFNCLFKRFVHRSRRRRELPKFEIFLRLRHKLFPTVLGGLSTSTVSRVLRCPRIPTIETGSRTLITRETPEHQSPRTPSRP